MITPINDDVLSSLDHTSLHLTIRVLPYSQAHPVLHDSLISTLHLCTYIPGSTVTHRGQAHDSCSCPYFCFCCPPNYCLCHIRSTASARPSATTQLERERARARLTARCAGSRVRARGNSGHQRRGAGVFGRWPSGRRVVDVLRGVEEDGDDDDEGDGNGNGVDEDKKVKKREREIARRKLGLKPMDGHVSITT